MDLAIYMIIATFITFLVGGVFALAWSVSAGHWSDLSAAKYAVFDEDDDPRLMAHRG